MKFEKYQMADGLSQDEYVRFTKLWDEFQIALHAGEVDNDIAFMLKCMENMIEAKTNEISELHQELYELHTAKPEKKRRVK